MKERRKIFQLFRQHKNSREDTTRYQEHLILNTAVQEPLIKDIYQRATIEACGALLGKRDEQGNWLVEQIYPLRNIFDSPIYFEFAPEELLEVELCHPDQMIGVYHSHPTGYARASETDKKNMKRVNLEQQIPWIWLIVCGPFDSAQTPPASLQHEHLIAYHHYATKGLQQVPVRLL